VTLTRRLIEENKSAATYQFVHKASATRILPLERSWNLSLVFFFLHFQGLKILPRVENLPLRFGGGVLSPVLPPSPTIVLWCCPVSSSKSRNSNLPSVQQFYGIRFFISLDYLQLKNTTPGPGKDEHSSISRRHSLSRFLYQLSSASFVKAAWYIKTGIIFSCLFSRLSVLWQGDAESSRTPPHSHS